MDHQISCDEGKTKKWYARTGRNPLWPILAPAHIIESDHIRRRRVTNRNVSVWFTFTMPCIKWWNWLCLARRRYRRGSVPNLICFDWSHFDHKSKTNWSYCGRQLMWMRRDSEENTLMRWWNLCAKLNWFVKPYKLALKENYTKRSRWRASAYTVLTFDLVNWLQVRTEYAWKAARQHTDKYRTKFIVLGAVLKRVKGRTRFSSLLQWNYRTMNLLSSFKYNIIWSQQIITDSLF